MKVTSTIRIGLAAMMSCALVMGALPAQPVSAEVTTYYVSQAIGNDTTNNGKSLSAPFKTIQRCANELQPGDTCEVSSGIYRETITPPSGTADASRITIKAASGANVVVSGTDPITGTWTSAGIAGTPAVYKTPYTRSSLIDETEEQFFIVPKDANGNLSADPTLLWEARWPNITSYNLNALKDKMAYIESATNMTTYYTVTDSTLPNINWTGATIWERGGDAYTGQTSTISAFNNVTKTLTMNPVTNDQSYYSPRQGNTYFLSGVLGALDVASEWHTDATNLYLWDPSGGVPANVEAKTRQTAFNLKGKSYITISGIRTMAANILMGTVGSTPSSYNVLDKIKAEYLYFSDYSHGTSIESQRERGINMVGDYNELKNSTIAYSTGTLIHLAGKGNRILNNSIHNGSYMATHDSLIRLSSGAENVIDHNEIRESGRGLLSIYQGSGVISYNDMYRGMKLSRDGGLIYAWGSDLGNSEFHHNWIHDSKGDDTSVGMYFDNYTENAIIHHNVIYNNDTGIQMGAPGNFKLVHNNTIVNNDKSFGFHGAAGYPDDFYGTRFYNNILTDKAFAIDSDRKLFPTTVAQGYNAISSVGLNFINPAGGNGNDFRLQTGSTAIDSGAAIAGITSTYTWGGTAPDAGAYELGGGSNSSNWIPSYNHSNYPVSPTWQLIDTLYMNRITNSAFERGLTNWLTWSSAGTETTVGSDTQYAIPVSPMPTKPNWINRGKNNKLRLGDGSSPAGGSTVGDGIEQSISGLKPNTAYTYSAWIYNIPTDPNIATPVSTETILLGAENYDATASTMPKVSIPSTSGKYVRQELSFTTGSLTAANGTTIKPRVQIFKNKSYANHYSFADDVGLIESGMFNSGLSDGNNLKDVAFVGAPATSTTAGATGSMILNGTLQNGSSASWTGATITFASSDPSIVRIDSSTGGVVSYTAMGSGQATVSAIARKGIIAKATSQIVTVYPLGSPPATDFTAKAYGTNASGFTTLNSTTNTYTLVGKGDNVWGTSDDFVYLKKSVLNSNAAGNKLTLKANIEFSSYDPASIGLMFREQDTAGSEHAEFRMDGAGDILRIVFRNTASGSTDLINHYKTGVKQIPATTGVIPRLLPIMLTKEGNIVKGFYLDGNQYVLFGQTTVNFTDGANILAGIALYSGAGRPEAKAVITDLQLTRNY
ncbi:right-handed parallel beta-helix repeat-containing protein [Paenibacillus qinlingensis]|uniref:right-handed parallel beta-helix repeat-containing protein n=1 Tax=Paenibacillus qinlingensis TaxID=1837343 RepID=UPI001566CCD3|nr:right-handed parallel beta-helix repeat-containing protein [Paenibacillus qinlingensis]NQX58049.1 right-handed parallel beta-helix repeat-containing protein [Paenibacillus qinlingensis]